MWSFSETVRRSKSVDEITPQHFAFLDHRQMADSVFAHDFHAFLIPASGPNCAILGLMISETWVVFELAP